MFFLNFSLLWNFNFFFLFLYIIIIFSVIIYNLPIVKDLINYNKFKSINSFEYLTGFDLYFFILTPIFLFFLINYTWTSCLVSSWFGNLIFSSFQYKINYLIFFFIYLLLTSYFSSFYFSSREIYDYIIVCLNKKKD
jgi:hypothetical protein